MIRFAALGAMLCLCSAAPELHARSTALPTWTLLNSLKAPSDALRWHGNTRPTTGHAQGVWDSVVQKKKRLNKQLEDWADTDTPKGIEKRKRIRKELDALDPVICRGSLGKRSYIGELHQAEGVCVLFKARKTHLMCETRRGPD